jgi:hypothetical protein
MEQSPAQVARIVTWSLRDLAGLVLTGRELAGDPARVEVTGRDRDGKMTEAWAATAYRVCVHLVCRHPGHMDLITAATVDVLQRLGLDEIVTAITCAMTRTPRQERQVTGTLTRDLDYTQPVTRADLIPAEPGPAPRKYDRSVDLQPREAEPPEKPCITCQVVKPLAQFARRPAGGTAGICRSCDRERRLPEPALARA